MSGQGKKMSPQAKVMSPQAKAFKELGQILANARDEFEELGEDKQSEYKMTWSTAMKRFVETYYPWFKTLSSNPAKYAKFLRKIKEPHFEITSAVLAFAAFGKFEEDDEKELKDVPAEEANEIIEEIKNMCDFTKVMRENPPPESA